MLPILILLNLTKMAMKSAGYDRTRQARFGRLNQQLSATDILWHCVSVGEVTAVTPLIRRLKQDNPNITITLTTTTPTGAAQVRKGLAGLVQHCYLPYDHIYLMAKLLKRIQPRLLLVTEVEIWPSLLHQCSKRNIPSIVINARMTERSARRYKKLGHLFEQTIKLVNVISTQGLDDFNAYKMLGANESQVQNNGNIKFDIIANNSRNETIDKLAEHCEKHIAPLLVAGSTHDPEEQLIINVHRQLRQSHQRLKTAIVPRHPQRFNEVNNKLVESGIPFQRFSTLSEINTRTEIILVDAMGFMQALYAIADVAFVGGSFAPRGGHNALEPALYKVPIVMGPSQFNNPQITTKLASAGALQTTNEEASLCVVINEWLGDKSKRETDGSKGLQVIKQNRGALEKNLKLIEAFLSS